MNVNMLYLGVCMHVYIYVRVCVYIYIHMVMHCMCTSISADLCICTRQRVIHTSIDYKSAVPWPMRMCTYEHVRVCVKV